MDETLLHAESQNLAKWRQIRSCINFFFFFIYCPEENANFEDFPKVHPPVNLIQFLNFLVSFVLNYYTSYNVAGASYRRPANIAPSTKMLNGISVCLT